MTSALKIILDIVRTITLGWAIIMAVSIAVKYMTGSPQIKSQLFGATGIMTIISHFVNDITK